MVKNSQNFRLPKFGNLFISIFHILAKFCTNFVFAGTPEFHRCLYRGMDETHRQRQLCAGALPYSLVFLIGEISPKSQIIKLNNFGDFQSPEVRGKRNRQMSILVFQRAAKNIEG